MAINPEPFPSDPIVTPRLKRRAVTGRILDLLNAIIENVQFSLSDSWAKYLTSQGDLVNSSPSRKAVIELEDQGASIGATSLIGDTGAGLYRLTYAARISRAASVSSSLTVQFTWTRGGVSQTFSGAAITGNTTASYQSETKLVNIDPATPITYQTTYASDSAGGMQYELAIWVER